MAPCVRKNSLNTPGNKGIMFTSARRASAFPSSSAHG
jgi:hypothetical protein